MFYLFVYIGLTYQTKKLSSGGLVTCISLAKHI